MNIEKVRQELRVNPKYKIVYKTFRTGGHFDKVKKQVLIGTVIVGTIAGILLKL